MTRDELLTMLVGTVIAGTFLLVLTGRKSRRYEVM
jgi:hypothetical protein